MNNIFYFRKKYLFECEICCNFFGTFLFFQDLVLAHNALTGWRYIWVVPQDHKASNYSYNPQKTSTFYPPVVNDQVLQPNPLGSTTMVMQPVVNVESVFVEWFFVSDLMWLQKYVTPLPLFKKTVLALFVV